MIIVIAVSAIQTVNEVRFTYRVGPELDNWGVVEGVDLAGQRQLPGANVDLRLTLQINVVVHPGFFEDILQQHINTT